MPPNGLYRAVGEGERNFLNSPSRDAGARTGARQPLPPLYQPISFLYQPYPLPYQLYPVAYQLYLRPATADTRKSRTTFWKVLRLFHRYSCLSASNSIPAAVAALPAHGNSTWCKVSKICCLSRCVKNQSSSFSRLGSAVIV